MISIRAAARGTASGHAAVTSAGFAAQVAVFGAAYTFGVVLEQARDDLGVSTATIALLPAIGAFVLFFAGPLTGRLADRHGAALSLRIAAVLLAAGLAVTAAAPNLVVAIVGFGVMVGLAASFAYVPAVSHVATLPTPRAPLLVGLVVAGVGAGTALLAPVVGWVAADHGWRTSYALYAAAGGVVLVVASAAFRRRGSGGAAPLPGAGVFSGLFRDRSFRRLYLSLMVVTPSLYVGFVFVASYATSQGISEQQAALLVALLGASSGAGRIVLAALGTRVSVPVLFRVSYGLLAGSLAVWLVAGSNFGLLALYVVVAGTGYGGLVGLAPTVTALAHGAANLGATLGVLYTAVGFGGLLTPPIAGAVIDRAGYTPVLVVTGALAAAGAVLVPRVGNRPQTRSRPME